MSEEEGKLEKPSAKLASTSDTPADRTTLSQVEERIAKANSPQEALFWTQIRGEFIKQNEIIQEGDRRRFVQQIQLWRRIGVSIAALTIGLVFFSIDLTEAGLLVIGVFLYELAPDLKKEAFVAEAKEKMISRPTQTVGFRSIVVGLILASATACLLFVIGTETTSGINQVLIIISGMSTVAALSAFERFIERHQKNISFVDEIFLDETLISKNIVEIEKSRASIDRADKTDKVSVPQSFPWDLSLNQLVGVDNSLALAQLRIEIERELRKIAYEHKIDISIRPIGIVGLAQELVYRDRIPVAWLEVLKDINTVCSRVVHGIEISNEQAISVIRVGGQMLEQLRLVVLK